MNAKQRRLARRIEVGVDWCGWLIGAGLEWRRCNSPSKGLAEGAGVRFGICRRHLRPAIRGGFITSPLPKKVAA